MQKEILEWLRNGQDWDAGVALYAKYGHNKTVLKNFLRKETKDRKAKLAYKLVSRAKLPESYITMNVNKLPKGDTSTGSVPNKHQQPKTGHSEQREESITLETASKAYKGKILFKDLPEEVQLMIVQRSTLEKKRSAAHQALDKVPKTNEEKNKSAREAINKEVDKYTGEINTLNTKIKYYEDNGKLYEEPKPGFIDKFMLNRNLMNLKSQRSKARAKVHGTETQNPIPDGPKKEAAKRKLEELEPKIEKLEKQLNA